MNRHIFNYCTKDNWSEWKEDACASHCLENSKGVIVKRRSCKHESYRTASCEGLYYDVVLCDDSKLCKKRMTIEEFTKYKCTLFSKVMNYDKLEEEPPGKQDPRLTARDCGKLVL